MQEIHTRKIEEAKYLAEEVESKFQRVGLRLRAAPPDGQQQRKTIFRRMMTKRRSRRRISVRGLDAATMEDLPVARGHGLERVSRAQADDEGRAAQEHGSWPGRK